MKKFICTRPAPGSNEKIWRKNENLELVKRKRTESEEMEYKYNDPTKYITGNKNSTDNFNFNTAILEEFPEYNAGWDVIITNTGLTCFYTSSQTKNKNNFVIYDMFDKDVISLSDINPDISMLLEYNMFDQPINVKKVNFKDNKFIPDYSYSYNNENYIFLNCDNISDYEFDSTKLMFKKNDLNLLTINNISFIYKPLFIFRLYDSNGKLKSGTIQINDSSDLIAKEYSKGIYFIDLSTVSPKENDGLVSISLDNCENGYLEVI